MEPQERPAHDVPVKWAVLILVAIFALACVPIWLVKYPPLVDYPMHVARAYLLSLPQDGQGITEFYQAKWQAIPNLGMDIVVSLMCKVMAPLIAGKIFLCVIIGGLLSGGFAFSVALHKRITIAAFLPALALYDQWFMMGFANYLFGLGIAFWTIAVWLWSENWSKPKRWVVLALLGGLLLTCHLLAFIVTLIAIALLHLKPIGKWTPSTLTIAGTVGACAVSYLGLTLLHKTPIDWSSRSDSVLGSYSFQSPTGLVAFLSFIVLAGKVVGSRAAPIFLLALIASLMGPSFLGGTAFAADRLSLVAIIVLLASLQIEKPYRPVVAVLAGAFLLTHGAMAFTWIGFARDGQAVSEALKEVNDGATIATIDLGLRHRHMWKYQRHTPDWILLDKPVFVAQNFAKNRQQPMVFQPDFEEWHKYQNNNPVEKDTWQDVVAELPRMQALQEKLIERRIAGGKTISPWFYILVLHKKGQAFDPKLSSELRLVSNGDEYTLLQAMSGLPRANR